LSRKRGTCGTKLVITVSRATTFRSSLVASLFLQVDFPTCLLSRGCVV